MTSQSHRSCTMDQLQTALIKLIKLIKTVRFYPPEHPTLKHVGEETFDAFQPLLQNGNLALTVRKDRILLDHEDTPQEHAGIRNLAHFLFARRIQRLFFLPELTTRDLIVFSRNVTLKTTDIQAKGGLQELLLTEQTTGIWINELDLSVIKAAKERIQHQTEQISVGTEQNAAAASPENQQIHHQQGVTSENTGDFALNEHLIDQLSLEQLLTQLPRESSDRRFKLLLNRVPPLVFQHLSECHLPLVLQTFQVLASLLGNRQLHKTRRGETLTCLHQVTSPIVIDFLIDTLCTRGVPKELRDRIMQTLVFLRDKSVAPLINRLTREKDTLARKLLSTNLVKLGATAVPELISALQNRHWYVVRNVVAILGQIANPQTASHLIPLIWSDDLRIARETIRALARIGGDQAVDALLQLVDSSHRELYPQAIIALGSIRNPVAVPSLVKIIESRDPFMKKTEIKIAAIKALGRIASDEAAPQLERLAKSRPWWKKDRKTTLRIQAIAALVKIGCPSSQPVLENLCRATDHRIAQSASRGLKQWPTN